MENRTRLRENGLVLIVIGILDLFMFIATMVKGIIDGTIANELATVAPDMLLAVKIGIGFVFALLALLVFADVLLGLKALKVSKNPDASKGYITFAKISMILTCIALISHVISIFDGNTHGVDAALNVASTTLSVAIYTMFIQSAEAVRNDAIAQGK